MPPSADMHACTRVCIHVRAHTHIYMLSGNGNFPTTAFPDCACHSLTGAVLSLFCKSSAARGQLNGFCDSLC